MQITSYYSVCMRTSGEKERISDEAERVQSVLYPYIRSLSGGLCNVMSLMPIEETVKQGLGLIV